MCSNVRAAKDACESSQLFIQRMRLERFSNALVCRRVLPQFHRLCPNLPFPSNHSEDQREDATGKVCSHRADIVLILRASEETSVLNPLRNPAVDTRPNTATSILPASASSPPQAPTRAA